MDQFGKSHVVLKNFLRSEAHPYSIALPARSKFLAAAETYSAVDHPSLRNWPRRRPSDSCTLRSTEARIEERADGGMGVGSRQVTQFRIWPLRGDQPLPTFEQLATPLFDSLYNFARWLTGDSRDAEDLVQETYLKALRGFASFQPGSNFRAWIFKILKNTFLSSRSKLEQRMTVEMDLDEDCLTIPATPSTPESVLIGHSSIRAVWSAIEQLPVPLREVILLCDVENASYREIAEILSIPSGTVMSRLARARKRVRASLSTVPGAPLSADLGHGIEAQ
jgi:RNA polymerase sigma-70 factor (ECF subfamily)